ncbi:hypothetical protein AB0K05_20910 [Nonomuraea sp. NPDC049486]|uniref:hypothetical protein n=1 Tax=unclassified Nonomuraea TaxID=2593643 RepID=UPI00343AF1F6
MLHSLAVGVIVVDLQRAAFIDRVIADPAAITMEEVEASDALYALTGMAELGRARGWSRSGGRSG